MSSSAEPQVSFVHPTIPANEIQIDPNIPVIAIDASSVQIPADFATTSRAPNKEFIETALMPSIKTEGQHQPIAVQVNKDGAYELVFGQNRLLACRQLGVPVLAIVKNHDEIRNQMARYTENLVRNELRTGKERDRNVAQWKSLYLKLNPMADGPKLRAHKAGIAAAKSRGQKHKDKVEAKTFEQVAAKDLGTSAQTVRHAAKRGATFSDNDYRIFEDREVSQTDQTKIAHLPKEDRDRVIELIAKGKKPAVALKTVKSPTVEAEAVNPAEVLTEEEMTSEQFVKSLPLYLNQVVRRALSEQAGAWHTFMYKNNGAGQRLMKLASTLSGAKTLSRTLGTAGAFTGPLARLAMVPHPSKWYECSACNGNGSVDVDGKPRSCEECHGTGISFQMPSSQKKAKKS